MFYIYENQIKADGTVNSVPAVGRQNIKSARSYFYERCSKMSATDLFDTVAIKLCDERLRQIDYRIFEDLLEVPQEEAETL